MRKLLLLPLLFCLFLAACKKDDAKPSANDLIKGKWATTTTQLIEYYDASNKKVYEESKTTTERQFELDGANVKETFEGQVKNGTYYLFQKNGQDYIHLEKSDKSEEYQIASINDTKMKWSVEIRNMQYKFGPGISDYRTADKAVITEELVKK